MTTSPDFWNRIAARYARDPISDEASYRYKLEATQKHLRPDMDLLEFACGTGTTALIHAPFVQSIHAIDYSAEMIAIARQKAAAEGIANVQFEIASIEELAAPDGSYDAVLGMSILHLLQDRAAVLAKVHRLLKPGGWFFSSTACLAEMNPLIRLALPVMRAIGKAPHVGIFTADALVAELEAAGFVTEQRWRPKKSAALYVEARKAP